MMQSLSDRFRSVAEREFAFLVRTCSFAGPEVAIFTFQRYWNAFIFPLVILRDPAKYPVQVGLATLQGEFNTDYGMLMTGAAVAALPMIAVFFAFQRQFVEGIRIGGVKG